MAATDTIRIDARGMRCPWPALRAARAMRSAGRVLVLADDPVAPGELAALAAGAQWQYMPVDDPAGPAFLLERQALPDDAL